jgi:hypothetical protein
MDDLLIVFGDTEEKIAKYKVRACLLPDLSSSDSMD